MQGLKSNPKFSKREPVKLPEIVQVPNLIMPKTKKMLKKEKKIAKKKVIDRRRRNLQSLSSFRDLQPRHNLSSKRKPYMSSRNLQNKSNLFEKNKSL